MRNEMKKHAYLVMAHNQYDILITTLRLLDHDNNSFYIHIDRKSNNVPWDEIKGATKKSKIIFVDRISVNWGGYSQIQCTMNLLKNAVKGNYDYYHLISGVDLPIKTKHQILDYFENHENVQYVHFEQSQMQEKYLDRIKTWYIFQEGAKNHKTCAMLGKCLKKMQAMLRIDRTKRTQEEIQFGASWFSITHSLAKYALEQEPWVHNIFKCGCCVDEMWLQSVIVNSPFKNELVHNAFSGEYMSCLRYVDWKRGTPYVFRISDFQDLITSPYLFARKFDLNVDEKIVSAIYKYLLEKDNQ